MSDFKDWLQSVGLEKYGEVFASHDIDLTVVPDLTEQDLEKLGLSLGHRRKFIAAAAKFRAAPTSSPVASAQAQPVDQLAPAVERRQLTVVFVDLVGSTALGRELDPEDLIQLLRQYRDACTAVIAKYDGFIAQYLGDGILVYFGFPQAQEHAAERAVRAGLEIVEKVGQLKQPDGPALQARVGIATGLVVTGDATGVGTAGEETVVGDTPNLAARLQSLAEPGCVLVGPTTHQLTSNFFEFSFLGEHAIKGFRDPISVWKVLGESAIENRFAAAHAAAAGPIVGRERELAFLYNSWQRATRGDGHVVLLAGEAGIGKSRLLEALAERVREEPHRLLRCQCSPYHRNSVLFPFKTLLRHRLDISRDLPTQENLDRISRMLERVGRHARSSTLLLAELLEVPSGDTLSSIEMTPKSAKGGNSRNSRRPVNGATGRARAAAAGGRALERPDDANTDRALTEAHRTRTRAGPDYPSSGTQNELVRTSSRHAYHLQANRARALRSVDPERRQPDANGRHTDPGDRDA